MNIKKIASGLVAIALIGGGIYYSNKGSESEVKDRSYLVESVKKATFNTTVEADGIVEARDTRLVYVDRNLKVAELNYDAGDYVTKGSVIMTFDPEDKNKLNRSIKREKLNLNQLERDLVNSYELFKVGGASKIEIEDIEYSIAKKKLEIEDIEEEMSKMVDEILSPFDGTIISLVAEENYRVNTEVELFEMADLSNIIIVAKVAEYDIRGVAIGQMVKIKPDAYNKSISGAIEKISTLSIEESGSEAYVEVEIAIDNVPDELRPGFNASVEIITKSSGDTTGVPRGAVLEDKDGNYVFIVSSTNVISKKRVSLGMTNSKSIEIDGLEVGEKIISDPDITLNEGDIITTRKMAATPSNERGSGERKAKGGSNG